MDGGNTSFLLGWPIFRCYVSFRGSSIYSCWTCWTLQLPSLFPAARQNRGTTQRHWLLWPPALSIEFQVTKSGCNNLQCTQVDVDGKFPGNHAMECPWLKSQRWSQLQADAVKLTSSSPVSDSNDHYPLKMAPPGSECQMSDPFFKCFTCVRKSVKIEFPEIW